MKKLTTLILCIAACLRLIAESVSVTSNFKPEELAGSYDCAGGVLQYGKGALLLNEDGSFEWDHIFDGGVCGNDEVAVFGDPVSESHEGEWTVTDHGEIELKIENGTCRFDGGYQKFFYVKSEDRRFLVQTPVIEYLIRLAISSETKSPEPFLNEMSVGYLKRKSVHN